MVPFGLGGATVVALDPPTSTLQKHGQAILGSSCTTPDWGLASALQDWNCVEALWDCLVFRRSIDHMGSHCPLSNPPGRESYGS